MANSLLVLTLLLLAAVAWGATIMERPRETLKGSETVYYNYPLTYGYPAYYPLVYYG